MEHRFTYDAEGMAMEAYAVTEAPQERRPCVLVAHAWDGPNEHVRGLARSLAALGFAALAIDVYGVGRRGAIDGDNHHLMDPLLADRMALRRRLLAAVEAAQALPWVQPDRLAVLGYCFGGLCALDLARAAPPGLRAAVAVHANLVAPTGLPLGPIPASVLVLHGWEDRTAPPEAVLALAEELTQAGADWQLHAYGHAMHAFTFEGVDLPELGLKHEPKAAARALASCRNFLAECLT